MTPAQQAPIRIYVKRGTKAHNAAAEFLLLYGIKPELQADGTGTYLDATPPSHWGKYRRERFKQGIHEFRSK
jgi:hypothetical protein